MFEFPRLSRLADVTTDGACKTVESTSNAVVEIAGTVEQTAGGINSLASVFNERMSVLKMKSMKETLIPAAELENEVKEIEEAIAAGKLNELIAARKAAEVQPEPVVVAS